MKRKLLYLYTLLLALMSGGMLSSCSNEDIDIQRVGKLEVRISTKTLYDTFNLTDAFKSGFLSQEGNEIGVTVFVYNEDGVLVNEQFQHSKTFDSLSFYYPQLNAGRYTFVVVETLVKEELGFKSDDWVFEKTNSLSTLEIKTNSDSSRGVEHYWYSAVGCSSITQYLDFDEESRINITPQAIGTIIDYNAINFANTEFDIIAFFTKDTPAGRYLSPEYQGDDRFHNDAYLKPNTWSTRSSISIKQSNDLTGATTYLLESGNLHYMFAGVKRNEIGSNEDGSTPIYGWPMEGSNIFTSDGEMYYGGVAYREVDGKISCPTSLFGSKSTYDEWEYEMLNSSATTTRVEYVKPYTVWGASMTAVSNYMKNLSGSTSFTGAFEDSNILSYINYKQTVQYDYYFDSNWNNYSHLIASFAKSAYTMDAVCSLISDMGLESAGYNENLNGYFFYNSDTAALAYYPESYPDDIFVMMVPSTSNAPSHSKDRSGVFDVEVIKNIKKAANNKALRKDLKSIR